MSTFITAFEIGSSKIKGAVGIVGDDKNLEVVALEEIPLSPGSVRHGCAVNVEEISMRINHIRQLLENNQRVHPRKIKRTYVSLGGRSIYSHPVEAIKNFNTETEITETALAEMKKQVRSNGANNKEILDVVPVNYNVDGKNVTVAVGTLGNQIRVKYNLIVCDPKIKKNLTRAFEKSDIEVIGGISRIRAIESLIMSRDQKGLGSVLIDFGAETTTVAVYKDYALRYLATIPMGSRLITKDLATLLNVSEDRAEELKKNYVNLSKKPDESDGLVADRTLDNIDYRLINNIALARVSEIIHNVEYQINQSRLKPEELPEGIVVVGNGSKLNGIKELLHNKLHMKVSYPGITEKIQFAYNLNTNPIDSLDVVAIMAIAAKNGIAKECTELPKTGGLEIEEFDSSENEQQVKPKEEPKPKKPKSPKKGWADSLTKGFIKLISPEEADFDEE